MKLSEEELDDFDDDEFLDEDVFDYNDYEPRIFSKEGNQETRFYTFRKSTGFQSAGLLKGVEPIAVQWSENFQELSIMLRNDFGEVSLAKGSFSVGGCGSRKKRYEPEKIKFPWNNTYGLDSFAFDRVSDKEYVFTDFNVWNGDVGVWDIESGKVQSVCFKEEGSGSLQAICGSHKTGAVYALGGGGHHYVRTGGGFEREVTIQYQYKENELSGYPLQQDFALHTSEGCQIEFLQDQMVLRLWGNRLQMVPLNQEETGWASNLSVQSYMKSDAGYLIATCYDTVSGSIC